MSVISVGQAAILGVVEGVTEFLPVSSTGHLKITEGLMNIPVDDDAVVGFSAVIQVGAIAAVLVYFFKDIVRIVTAWGRGLRNREERYHHDYKFAWWVIYATIPIVVVGLRGQAADRGTARLTVGGGRLADRRQRRDVGGRPDGRHKRGEDDTSFKDAMLVGSSQILALLFPGFSRSGATMSTAPHPRPGPGGGHPALVLPRHPGPDRRGPLRAKDALGARRRRRSAGRGHPGVFVVAYASIAWLLKFVAKHSFNAFVIYRIIIGVLLFGLLGTGALS